MITFKIFILSTIVRLFWFIFEKRKVIKEGCCIVYATVILIMGIGKHTNIYITARNRDEMMR